MKNVAIIGYGYVGKAMVDFFQDHYNLVVVDIMFNTSDSQLRQNVDKCEFTNDYNRANGADMVVICLPTPRDDNGFCDTSIVEEALRTIDSSLFLIKSTVEPGTTERLIKETGKNIVFSPEYCGESKYWSPYAFDTDVKETPWFTFGGDPEHTEKCVELFIKIVGPTKTYHQTDSTTAELAKYVENTFYAMKVTFCYEIDQICKKLGVDYYKLREAWLLDPRINPMHTAVFSESENPYGGKCVPGDSRIKVTGFCGNCPDGISPFSDSEADIANDCSIEEYYDFVNRRKKNDLPSANRMTEIGEDKVVRIFSANSDMSDMDTKKIHEVTCREINEDIYVFETDAGNFECTEEHLMPILRNNEICIVQAKDINESDELFCTKMGKHFAAKGETDDIERDSNKKRNESMV